MTDFLDLEMVAAVFARLLSHIVDQLGHTQLLYGQLIDLLLKVTPLIKVESDRLPRYLFQLLLKCNG